MFTILQKIVQNIIRTYKNKLWALVLLVIGFITMKVSNDSTVMILLAVFSATLFFSKENYF